MRSLKETRKSVCVFFTTVCNSSITNTTSKPSHRNHSIIPLSNHHTKIIPKSIELRNICMIIIIIIIIIIILTNTRTAQTKRVQQRGSNGREGDGRYRAQKRLWTVARLTVFSTLRYPKSWTNRRRRRLES